jgi:galactose-1-phosphate uridylyltransferase
MKRELTRDRLNECLQSERLDDLSVSRLFDLFEKEPGTSDFAPDGSVAVDPRDGAVVLYNEARARRPHDNKADDPPGPPREKPCPICDGKTTGIVDVAPLSTGHTFINKNLFPCVHTTAASVSRPPAPIHRAAVSAGTSAFGLHLLQWTSTRHDRDWHNMPVEDLVVVLERLAALEKKLLFESDGIMPDTSQWQGDGGARGFVSIVKNLGAPVGGSLTHGHQQIVYSNVMPAQTHNDLAFQTTHGAPFARHLLDHTEEPLVVKRYGAATVVVPYFMKRPYYSMLVLGNTRKEYLHQLDGDERRALARGWSEITRAFRMLMPRMGREFAYNALVHNGPGAGLYVEFLPYTQEDGGYERLGLWVCQESPERAATTLRELMGY